MRRTFVAVSLPPEILGDLQAAVRSLSELGLSGRGVRRSAMHLTLKFLGDVPATQTEAITAAVSKPANAWRPFELKLGAVGVYPSPGRARVLWVGLAGDLAPLVDLQHEVENALTCLGFEREARPYSPHLTVARIGDRASASDRRRALNVLHGVELREGPPFAVGSIVLMKSELSREGARHYPLTRIPLGDTLRRDTP